MPEPIQKIADSRYAAQLLAAHPEWAGELADPAPFAREEIERELAAGAADDEPALKRRLPQVRSRVLLRVVARDPSRRAALEEGCATSNDRPRAADATSPRSLGP